MQVDVQLTRSIAGESGGIQLSSACRPMAGIAGIRLQGNQHPAVLAGKGEVDM